MVCDHCRTEHDATLGTCPTCGSITHAHDELVTRVLPTPGSMGAPRDSSLESDLETGGVQGPASGSVSGSLESDIETGAGRNRQQQSPLSRSRSLGGAGWTAAEDATAVSGNVCLMPGALLGGRYEILKSLGEGGMGSVYQARDLEVNRAVAIKIIRPELANDPMIVQRFKQELVLARQVTHRNVVRIYDLGVASGLRFISMEYIDGRELSDVIRDRGKCQPKEAAEIMLQVCQGLEAAHTQGVIHRDLKPQNIMLDAQGRAAVMDFGIAHAAMGIEDEAGGATSGGSDDLTHVGALIGTPRYMSPEQAHGERVDARSDIYTVGLIFYELLAGKLPFSASSVKELLRNRGKDTVPPLTAVDASIPKRLNELVLKCLQSDPGSRYQTVTEIVEDLEIWLGVRPNPAAKGLKRWNLVASSIALLAMVALSLLIRERLASNAARAHRPVSVLITDFRNTTGQQLLSSVVEPMLQVGIEGASFISSFNRGQAHKIASAIQPGTSSVDERLGRLIALREGIGVVLGGAIDRHDSKLRLSANATDANGKVLVSDSVDFNRPDDLPKAVDKIASRVRRVLGDASHTAEKSAAETFTSGSLASAKMYATAQQLQWDGKWAEAIAAWKEAAALDPKMSRAYAGIAATLANRGDRKEAAHYYQLALANINRVSEREKYRTRGGYYLLTRDYKKAAEQFEQLLKQYPADNAAMANLAFAQFYARNMTAALEQGRKAVQLYPQNLLQRNNVGLYAMYAGDFDAAVKESQAIIQINPSFEKAYLCLGISQLQNGSPDQAAVTYTKLSKLSDWGASEGALGLGDLALYQGRFRDATQVLQQGITADSAQKNASAAAVKLVALAQAELHRKQRNAALKAAAQAAAASDDESVLYPAAAVELMAGNLQEAAMIGKRLTERFDSDPRALGKLIEGEIHMASGKLHEALASFEESQKLADTWLGRYDLGRAYLAAKLYPDAENEFDICLKRRGEASAVFLDDEPTVRYVPEMYYYLGIAKAGLNSSDALDDFKTFLSMKANSEPDPLVADARRRVQVQ